MIIPLAERGWVPDALVRLGIRRLLSRRLSTEQQDSPEHMEQRKQALLRQFSEAPVAVSQAVANMQHYEVPAEFFELVLGPRLKYSSGYWCDDVRTLEEAERRMLSLTCERAMLDDGQRILELGCGWGSLSLWMAEHYPGSQILAVSNSASQRSYIEAQARDRGILNLRVITEDVANFDPQETFDRVVSVEMFEHMRNHGLLMQRIHDWLAPGGKLFVHIFCHKELLYPFEEEGEANWMGRMFFTGGMMPSWDLLMRCQGCLPLDEAWEVNGNHYAKTLEAWLDNADARRETLMPILEDVYGKPQARVWLQRWRMFFMACSELFAYDKGQQWFVGHYRFGRID